jgi:flavin-dependent dehydrogenase
MLNATSLRFLDGIGVAPDGLAVDPGVVRFRYLDWVRDRVKSTSLEFVNAEREDFDQWLLSLLPDSVEILPATSVLDAAQDEGSCVVALGNGETPSTVSCSHLIGCDGARSIVRRSIGRGTQVVYVTVQDRVELHGEAEPWFDCIAVPDVGDGHAYTYVVPKEDTALVGSVFYPGTRRPGELQDRVLDAVRERRDEIGESLAREGGAALAVRRAEDVVRGEGAMLLAGEAAGLISPTSGEGISYALRSGHLAGKAVAQAANGDALERYRSATGAMTTDVRRRLRWLPVMESSFGRWMAGLMPDWVVDRVTQGL